MVKDRGGLELVLGGRCLELVLVGEGVELILVGEGLELGEIRMWVDQGLLL